MFLSSRKWPSEMKSHSPLNLASSVAFNISTSVFTEIIYISFSVCFFFTTHQVTLQNTT